jgi:hypothetical protein
MVSDHTSTVASSARVIATAAALEALTEGQACRR